jgi:hypothetical protein
VLESAGERAVLLAGPDGSGKSTLLQSVASEVAPRRRAVYLGHPRLPLGGFWMRLAGDLDLEPGYDAKRRVLRLASDLAREGGSLLLLVDDADELPAETLYALIASARSEPGLQLVLARSDASSLAGPLPDDVPVVRIGGVVPPQPAPVPERPEPPASALPALTARRRSRERRARAAVGVSGALLGLLIGMLVADPVWRALGARPTLVPALPAESAAAPPPDPSQEAPPLAASERSIAPPRSGLGELTAPSREPAPFREPAPTPREVEPPPVAAAPPGSGEPLPAPAAPPVTAPRDAPAAAPPTAAPLAPAPRAPHADAAPPRAPAPSLRAEPRTAAPAAPLAPPPAARAPDVAAPRPRPGPPAFGRLSVASDSDVRIEIDGRPYGAPPLAGIQLSRGEHRVLAHYPDGAVALKTIYLDTENVSLFFR